LSRLQAVAAREAGTSLAGPVLKTHYRPALGQCAYSSGDAPNKTKAVTYLDGIDESAIAAGEGSGPQLLTRFFYGARKNTRLAELVETIVRSQICAIFDVQ